MYEREGRLGQLNRDNIPCRHNGITEMVAVGVLYIIVLNTSEYISLQFCDAQDSAAWMSNVQSRISIALAMA